MTTDACDAPLTCDTALTTGTTRATATRAALATGSTAASCAALPRGTGLTREARDACNAAFAPGATPTARAGLACARPTRASRAAVARPRRIAAVERVAVAVEVSIRAPDERAHAADAAGIADLRVALNATAAAMVVESQ